MSLVKEGIPSWLLRATYIRMPMQLPQPTRRQRDDGSSDSLGDRERSRVDDAQSAALAGHVLERVVLCIVHVRGVARQFAVATRHVVRVVVRGDDVWIRRRHAAEDRFRETKILR
jgi:hypothetical protein